jgi:hypothetical protein
MYFVLPVWLAVGYLCHRAASLATTSGWKESLLHLFARHPTLAAIFLENAAARTGPHPELLRPRVVEHYQRS